LTAPDVVLLFAGVVMVAVGATESASENETNGLTA
jgi:hypothetical protein